MKQNTYRCKFCACEWGLRFISYHYSVNQKLFNIKLTWVVRGMMDVFHVYCFKSVGSYKHKLSRIESLVILYWGINCSIESNSRLNNCCKCLVGEASGC